jgi:sugar/nucleoside kinase (ribokinase family)
VVTPAPLVLVVGAVTRDLDLRDERAAAVPGGVVVHAGTALARLGARVRIVTRVRPDDQAALLAPLVAEGVEVRALPSAATTTYANDYAGRATRHELRATSDPIGPDDVPADWRVADVVQLGPLHPADDAPETAAALRGLRGLDVQGLVRWPEPGGTRLGPNSRLPAFLACADVVQASEEELAPVLDGESLDRFVARHGVRELVVTRGARGATVVASGRTHDVAAVPAPGGVRVGAGDVHLAVYLLLRVRGRDPVRAARGAAAVVARRMAGGAVPRDALATLD